LKLNLALQIIENDKLREQLQSFITQYDARDKHFEAQIQAKEAEKLAAEEKQAQVGIFIIIASEPFLTFLSSNSG
jgi:hypothetical protein